LDDTGLGCIVTGLFLGIVDDGSRHGGNEDNRARLALGDHSFAYSLRHEKGASEIDIDQSAEHGMVINFGWDIRAADDSVNVQMFTETTMKAKVKLKVNQGTTYSAMPAELMRTSGAPYFLTTASTALLIASPSRTSTLINSTGIWFPVSL
jgi:hypothetical protein